VKTLEDLQELILEKYNVELRFVEDVKQDIKAINKGHRQTVLLEILRRAKQGPLFKPDGVAESLHGDLHGFAKIKSKSLNIRIIYRPVEGQPIRMEIIAIGPRDKEKAYRMAAERLQKFFMEMG
jgi:mRNA interferase RelE/StbE